MKRQKLNGFISGVVSTLLVVALIGSAAATVAKRTLDIEYNDIQIKLNGQVVTPTDANGNPVEPFASSGTTYLPVRAVGNALGLTVDWDSATNTVLLDGGQTEDMAGADWDLVFAYRLAHELCLVAYKANLTANDIYEQGYAAMMSTETSGATVKRSCALQKEQISAIEGMRGVIDSAVNELPDCESKTQLLDLSSDLKYALIDLQLPIDGLIEMADAGMTNYNSKQNQNGYDAFWNYFSGEQGPAYSTLYTLTETSDTVASDIFDLIYE